MKRQEELGSLRVADGQWLSMVVLVDLVSVVDHLLTTDQRWDLPCCGLLPGAQHDKEDAKGGQVQTLQPPCMYICIYLNLN